MMNFTKGTCGKCGRVNVELMFSNNPLTDTTKHICFNCINAQLDYHNLDHVDFFCRTYNLPVKPDLWISLAETFGADVWKEYTRLILDSETDKQNLYYTSATKDLWAQTTKEWAKTRSFAELLTKLTSIKESYITRGRLKWGEQYNFQELIKLDHIYSRTLRANNITNPLQKEAVRTLCKLQIEIDNAIRIGDAKALKDFSNAWSTFAKQADLDTMIAETKTSDITTVAELYEYMERQGFEFKYYDNFDRDEVDRTIKDLTQANSRLILEATGLQPLLEEMMRKKLEKEEEAQFEEVTETTSIQDLLDFHPTDMVVEEEEDDEALNADFGDDA